MNHRTHVLKNLEKPRETMANRWSTKALDREAMCRRPVVHRGRLAFEIKHRLERG